MASKPYFRKVVKVKPVYTGQIGTIVSLLFNKNYLRLSFSILVHLAVGQLYGFISACTLLPCGNALSLKIKALDNLCMTRVMQMHEDKVK